MERYFHFILYKKSMHKLNIPALSVNKSYKGRRFATEELTVFKNSIYRLAPRLEIPKGKLQIKFKFGVSSKASDLDNLLKSTIDSLAEKYRFNDKCIYRIETEKEDVKKDREYIEFIIEEYGKFDKTE